jgi:hypothetical protein
MGGIPAMPPTALVNTPGLRISVRKRTSKITSGMASWLLSTLNA